MLYGAEIDFPASRRAKSPCVAAVKWTQWCLTPICCSLFLSSLRGWDVMYELSGL